MRHFHFPIIFSILFLSFYSHSQTEKYVYQGKDLTPVVNEVQKRIKVVQKPFSVYHWFSVTNGPNSAVDPNLLDTMREKSANFWSNFGKDARGDVLGIGLYVAIDPIVTQNYGGTDWGMTQLQLLAGTRLLQLQDYPEGAPLSAESIQILSQFDCTNVKDDLSLIRPKRDTSTGAYPVYSDQCWSALRFILKSARFDGIIYNYISSTFAQCPGRSNGSIALVISNPSVIKPSTTKVFTKNTLDAKDDRIRITSLFYKLSTDITRDRQILKTSNELREISIKYVRTYHPNYTYQMISKYCPFENQDCTQTWSICPIKSFQGSSECIEIPEPSDYFSPRLYPSAIKSTELPLTYFTLPNVLMWKDLDGEPTDPKIEEWIANNLYGCGK